MKELEDTKCEVRRTIDLQFSIWDRPNTSLEEENAKSSGQSCFDCCENPLGHFFEDSAYAWISYGSRLVVVDTKTGTAISSWIFRERITSVSQFPAPKGQIPLLLVGLANGASRVRDSFGLLCIFDCTTSQVLTAIRMPAGVEQACVVTGGTEWEDFGDKKIDTALGQCSGIACVALRNFSHLMIDLKRMSWEGPDRATSHDEAYPAELNFVEENATTSTRHRSSRERHSAYNLMNDRLEKYIGFNRDEFESSSIYQESLTSSLICSRKIGCLVASCLGRIIIWQTDGDVRWISAPLDENMSITHLALLEPTDDPRPFCYLWAAYQEETCRSPLILRMYAMLFERKYTDKGGNTYFNLETDPSVKFELEIEDNERITSLCPITRDGNPEQTDSTYRRGEDSLLLISMETRSILFDLNQWYKEQMPQTIGECNNPNAIIANYRTRPEVHGTTEDTIISSAYISETLSEFPCNVLTPAEELFYPNSLSLEWLDLSRSRLTFWATRGLQADILREMSITGPVILIEPTEIFNRCAAAGLVSTNSDYSANNDKDLQREMLLSLCLEQRWSKFLLKCAKEWSDGSASYLFHAFLRWGMQRASSIKLMTDHLSVPLYDQSGTGIGEAEIKQLRFYCQQLECITNVVSNLQIDTVDLSKERRALHRVSTYLHVLLWFYDVGLLPETQEIEEEAPLPVPFSLKIPYPYERLATMYREKRQEFGKNSTKNEAEHEEDMFIDELVIRECPALKTQWKREGGELNVGGYYPPSSLQSLLRSYLTDCQNGSDSAEMDNKHQITIYLLMDLAMLLQNSCPSVNQLIKYPSAFKLSPSLIKLTQALWLLDHEDYHGFLDMMTGQLVSDSDVKDWHHRLVMRTLIRNNQNKLALIYLRVRKPPLSSLDDQSTVISLSVEHGLVQSAFHQRPASHYAQLLTNFYRACKKYDKLHDILHLALDHEEEQIFVKFLENEKIDDTRLLYYLQRCRYAEASNVYPQISGASSRGHYSKNTDKSAPLMIFNAYNTTLPNITRKFSANVGAKATNIDATSRYPRPMSHSKNRTKTRDIHETVMRKARETFLHCDRSRIPFVSAPCFALTCQPDVVETNSVLFVEPLKKQGGKRSLDDMRGSDVESTNNEEDRKRRKTEDPTRKEEGHGANDREIGMTMFFDTPLVKRKNPITSGRNAPVETPHSILKIRQLIRDSASPCHSDESLRKNSEHRLHDRERKRRQIRFSLGQQQDNQESMKRDASPLDTMETPEIQNETNDVERIEKDLDEDEISEAEATEESYYSPNVSAKSYYEPTLLTDTTNVSINVSGPRPRPGLRRSSESTPYDLLKNKFNRTVNASMDSTKMTSELSFTLNENFTNDPRSSEALEIGHLLSETAYTASILSSDTSFECTLPTKWTLPGPARESTLSFSEKSVEKCRNTSSLPVFSTDRSEIFHKISQTVTRRSSIKRSKVLEEYTDDVEEDKNSEVLLEIDGFGLDQESSNQSLVKNTWDIDANVAKMENVEPSMIRNDTETTVRMDEHFEVEQGKDDDDDKSSHEKVCRSFRVPEEDEIDNETREDEETDKESEDEDRIREKSNKGSEIGDTSDNLKKRETPSPDHGDNCQMDTNEMEVVKTNDDGDDELLALRYEEEEDDDEEEVHQSLSNPMEIDADVSKPILEKSTVSCDQVGETTKKSSATSTDNGFYDTPQIFSHDINITDDESSRSVDGSALNVDSGRMENDLDKTLSVEKMQSDIMNEASNMTNDDSSSSFDSCLFSIKKSSQDSKNVPNSSVDTDKISNLNSSSRDSSSLFSSRKPQNFTEISKTTTDVEKEDESYKNTSAGSSSVLETIASDGKERDVDKISNNAIDTGNDDDKLEVKRSLRAKREKETPGKVDTPKRSKTPPVETQTSTPLRMTRSRRASSIIGEQSPMPESPITRSGESRRLRRANSLAKDFITSIDEPFTNTVENKLNPKTSRLRRSMSLVKELTPVKSILTQKVPDEEELKEEDDDNDEEVPIGRRTRRATTMQKSISVPTKTKITRSSSKTSLVEDSFEEPPAIRKTTRAKKASSKDNDANIVPKRLTRASSLVKDTPEKEDDATLTSKTTTSTRKTTRKRGNSVPKETSMETSTRASSSRTRRGGSVAKEVIPEESKSDTEDTKTQRGTSNLREKIVVGAMKSTASPTASTRSRLSSITSIPEEHEEEDEESDDELFSWGGKSVENKKNSRLRRAVSVDSSPVAIKRRTRAVSLKSIVIDEPIQEETFEIDSTSGRKTVAKKAPIRRKRTASASSSRENVEEMTSEKLPPRRMRKVSQSSRESETFRFSPPSKVHGRPDADDEKGTSEVPNYIFSPPHTRSKDHDPLPRRKVNRDFIPLTAKEREIGKLAMEGSASRLPVQLTGQTRHPFVLYGPRKIFTIPKRSKSLTDALAEPHRKFRDDINDYLRRKAK